jgi:ribosomal protein L35AE/L33A
LTWIVFQAASAVAEDAAGLVPLKYETPKAMFTGTPKNIKAAPTLEPYSEKPAPSLMVPPGCTNLAAKKRVTSSDANPIIGELSLVTDGDKDGSDGSFVELAPGKQWVQIDLEQAADISAVVIWHYHAEGRVYHSVVIQISDDPDFTKDVKTVYNNDFENALGFGVGKNLEYIDDYRGKAMAVKDDKGQPVRGRYVRLHSNGNTSSDQNHYVEVEVHGKAAK